MKISIERFTKIMNKMERTFEFENNVSKLCSGYEDIVYGEPMYRNGWLIDTVVELLETIMNDNTHLISYWVFECDFGKEFSIGDILINDKAIDISTVDKLYDYLKKDYNND